MYPLVVPLHHEAPVDPTLMEWIREQMNNVFGLGPEMMVVISGLMVLAIPVAILATYAYQRRRG